MIHLSVEDTGFTGEMYAEPSRELYRKLGMTIENLNGPPAGEQKRSYVTGVLSNVMKSIWVGYFYFFTVAINQLYVSQ